MKARGRIRRRLLGAITLGVLVWPAVHLGLVARYGIDPWELFGWAMYARPPARVQVAVEVERGGVTRPWRPMGADRRRLEAFARRRTALGRLASPEPLAGHVFAADAAIDAVTIVLRSVELDPGTARLVARTQRRRFEREP